MKNFFTTVIGVALFLCGLVWVYTLLPLGATLLLAIATAATAETLASGWASRGMSRPVSLAVSYFVGVTALSLLVIAVLPPLGAELNALAKDARPMVEAFTQSWQQRGSGWAVLSSVIPAPESIDRLLSVRWKEFFNGLLVFGESTASILVVFVLAIYWSSHRLAMMPALHGLWPAAYRTRIRQILGQMEVALGLHILVEGMASLLTLCLVFVVAVAQGMPFPVILSVAVALLRLIPFLGPTLCLIAGTIAGHGVDTSSAIVTPIAVLCVERLANVFANKALTHRRHNALLVVIVSIATVKLGGWVGLFVAPALASVVEVVTTALRTNNTSNTVAMSTAERLTSVQKSLADLPEIRVRYLLPLIEKLKAQLNQEDTTKKSGG